MDDRSLQQAARADIVVMAAAPADFTVPHAAAHKVKKDGSDGLELSLVQTTDVLASLGRHRQPGQTIVGFAAETAGSRDELVALGRAKLARKGADLLVCNDVSGGRVFGAADNTVVIVDRDGIVAEPSGTKDIVGDHICTALLAARAGSAAPA